MLLELFGAKVQTGESKSTTHIEIKSCITNLLQLNLFLRHRKVSFPYINVCDLLSI